MAFPTREQVSADPGAQIRQHLPRPQAAAGAGVSTRGVCAALTPREQNGVALTDTRGHRPYTLATWHLWETFVVDWGRAWVHPSPQPEPPHPGDPGRWPRPACSRLQPRPCCPLHSGPLGTAPAVRGPGLTPGATFPHPLLQGHKWDCPAMEEWAVGWAGVLTGGLEGFREEARI